MHVNLVSLEIVWERLLDIEDLGVGERFVDKEPVEDVVDVGGIRYSAVEVGGKPVDVEPVGNGANGGEPVVVPIGVVAAKLHFEAVETIAGDPVLEVQRVSVVGFVSCQIGGSERVETSH